MTQETFQKAQDLDSRIARLGYEKILAASIMDYFEIKIVGRNSRGDEHLLAVLDKGDNIRELISKHLLFRLEMEQTPLISEFENL